MKLNIKGFKGRLINWLLPKFIDYLKELLTKMSGKARDKLIDAIQEFDKECRKSSNKYDDIAADILKGIFDIK